MFKDTYYREGARFVNEVAEKKYVSHIFILNLKFSLFYSNKTLLIFLLNNLCYKKKWLISGWRSSHKPKSLLVSALHLDLRSLPCHVWQSTTLMLLWGASIVVTWRGLDISLHVWHHLLVLVLLLLVVRLLYQTRPKSSRHQSLSLYINKLRGCCSCPNSTSSP